MQIGKGNVPLGSRRWMPFLEERFLSLNLWNPRRMFWLQWRWRNRCVLEQERRQRCYRKMPVERKVEIFITLAQGQDGNLVCICSEDRDLFEHWWSWLTLILEQQIHYSETGGHVLTPSFNTCQRRWFLWRESGQFRRKQKIHRVEIGQWSPSDGPREYASKMLIR